MTPTEKDAMALAVLAQAANECEAVGIADADAELERHWAQEISQARAHLASRIAELEETREVLFGGLDRDRDNITTRNLAVVAINALARERDRATRAEAELAAVRGLLIEIRGDCEFAYGVSEHNYRQFCDSGAMGRMPSDTWARHCQRRIEQIDAARGGE